jgi:hypothetical protein
MAHLFGSRLGARAKGLAVVGGLTLILTACAGNSGNGGGGGNSTPTATLSANPPASFPGQSVILSFTSTNANQGSIDMGEGPVGANGSVTVMPTVTTTYTFTATGSGGSASQSTTVTVNQITAFDGLKQSDGVTDQDVDPNGAIGTKQYLEYVNTSLQAYDKATGAPIWPNPLPVENLWTEGTTVGTPGHDCNHTIGGVPNPLIQLDVVVIFDRLASRWVIGAKTSDDNAQLGFTYHFCLAVSNTDDLHANTLAWTGFSLDLDPTMGKDAEGHAFFPDWPKISTWTDASGSQSAYFATMDLLDRSNFFSEAGAEVCAFDRENIIHGGTVRSPLCTNVSHIKDSRLWSGTDPILPLFIGHSLIPADIEGQTLPPSGRDEFMVSIQNPINDLTTLTSTSLNLWQFHLDWNASTITPTLSTVTVDSYMPGCYLYAADNPAITNCAQEPVTLIDPLQPQIVDSVGDRLMPRFAYRNFGTYESYLVTHTIQTGADTVNNATQTGVRWYEFRDNGSGTPTLNQSDTINPDNVLYRFLPSVAQDQAGNVAVGYSTSNKNNDPGIYFSYWNLNHATAPAEILIFQGLGEEVTPLPPFGGKWGSYSSMTVDPVDDCTFWYVNEYFTPDNSDPTGNTWLTKIANFKVPGCQ